MARRNVKKMGLGDFLGGDAAHYNPEAALPTGPRARADDDEGRRGFGGRGGRNDDRYGDRGDRGDRRGGFEREREPMRSEQSDQWRGDRGAMGGSGGRFGRGEDRFGGGSRYDRPSREAPVEERPSYMRLNLQSRTSGAAPSSPRRNESRDGGDKFASAFGSRGGSSSRFGSGDRYGGSHGGYEDRNGSRFNRDEEYESSNLSSAFGRMNTNERSSPTKRSEPVVDEEAERKAKAQQARQERKQKAEEERKTAEEAKRQAAEAKKAAEEAARVQAKADQAIMAKVLASNKLGDELAAVAKKIFAEEGRPSGAVLFEAVTAKAADVAKASANWLAPAQYGALVLTAMQGASVKDQVYALYALQQFLNTYDFPKGVMEKCFMALYTLDMIEDRAFIEYKYDVENDIPGRMKAIVQTSAWLTWLETPEEGSDEEEDE